MLKNITIGQYYPIESPIHRLDPRVKLVGTALFMVSLFLFRSFTPYLFVVLCLSLVTWLSKIPFKVIMQGLRPLFWLLLFTLAMNLFLTPGKELWRWGFLRLTYEGVSLGMFMFIRLVLLVAGTSLMTLSTSPIQLTDGIEKLLRPYQRLGLPAHEIAMMMTIALRFIPTLIEETDKIMKAQMARGADLESRNLFKKAKSLVPILVPLFVSALRRADELAMAMESRCYRGSQGRTRMKEIRYHRKDYMAYGWMGLYVGAVLALRFTPWP